MCRLTPQRMFIVDEEHRTELENHSFRRLLRWTCQKHKTIQLEFEPPQLTDDPVPPKHDDPPIVLRMDMEKPEVLRVCSLSLRFADAAAHEGVCLLFHAQEMAAYIHISMRRSTRRRGRQAKCFWEVRCNCHCDCLSPLHSHLAL